MKKKLKSPADISRELVVLPSESEGKGGRREFEAKSDVGRRVFS